MISLVVAKAHRNVIGRSNNLPWYLPADLKHFKEITTGKTVVMGRRTSDSIIARLGHGLPNRTNIVVTRDSSYQKEGMTIVHAIDEALAYGTENELMVIGGAELYRQTIDRADRLYVTEIDLDIDGDTFFPRIDPALWREVARESHTRDERNPNDYDFVIFDRIV